MASVRDLVAVGFDEGLVKQAVDAAGFTRTRGRGGLNLSAKDVAKVMKAYNALLAKLTVKIAKFNPDKLSYGDEDETSAPRAKAEKKAPAKAPKTKAKPAPEPEDDEDDDAEAEDQDDDVEEVDDEEEEE